MLCCVCRTALARTRLGCPAGHFTLVCSWAFDTRRPRCAELLPRCPACDQPWTTQAAFDPLAPPVPMFPVTYPQSLAAAQASPFATLDLETPSAYDCALAATAAAPVAAAMPAAAAAAASPATAPPEFRSRLFRQDPARRRRAAQAAAPPVLVWSVARGVYVPHAQPFQPSAPSPAQLRENPDLRDWVRGKLATWLDQSRDQHLPDSHQIITQIIELLDAVAEAEPDESSPRFVFIMDHEEELQGVSCFQLRGEMEGTAERIPDDVEDWWYAIYTAANPASQLPRERRQDGAIGGVGPACHAFYRSLCDRTGLPIFRHQTSQRSHELALREGHQLVYTDRQ